MINMCVWASRFFQNSIFLESPPTWNAFTWSSRCGQLILMTFLDWQGLLWPGSASWPLHKNHSGYREVLKLLKLWHWFKIFPVFADLCHIIKIVFQTCSGLHQFFNISHIIVYFQVLYNIYIYIQCMLELPNCRPFELLYCYGDLKSAA